MSITRLFTIFNEYVSTYLYNVRASDKLFLLADYFISILLKRSAVVADACKLRDGVYVPSLITGEAFYGKRRSENHFKTMLIC